MSELDAISIHHYPNEITYAYVIMRIKFIARLNYSVGIKNSNSVLIRRGRNVLIDRRQNITISKTKLHVFISCHIRCRSFFISRGNLVSEGRFVFIFRKIYYQRAGTIIIPYEFIPSRNSSLCHGSFHSSKVFLLILFSLKVFYMNIFCIRRNIVFIAFR